MRLPLAAAAALLALAAPRAARAGPELALRLGLAPALGSVVDHVPVGDEVALQAPVVQLDALWREGRLAAGAYGSWGWSGVGRCEGSCSGSVRRLGLQATLGFVPRWQGGEPWAGIAAGYEWAVAQRARGGTEVTTTWRGFEALAAQGGVDWRVARWLALGPYLLVGAGRYARVAVDTDLDSGSSDLARKALHAWIHAGVRARLVLGGEP